MPDAGSSASTFASQAIASIMTTYETPGGWPESVPFVEVELSRKFVSE